MPKRTNFFQKLIYQLHKQLAGNAVVTESKMFIDKETGSQVEVDIVIESVFRLLFIFIELDSLLVKDFITFSLFRVSNIILSSNLSNIPKVNNVL